jgi:YD repeat-containing protein
LGIVSYACTAAGRLASRTWARGTNAAYAYDTAGDLLSVTYNDSVTPSVTNFYDGLGRVSLVVCGGVTTSFVYDWAKGRPTGSHLNI